jgi:hypothetical protein
VCVLIPKFVFVCKSGAPLTEIDLVPMEELGVEIRQWILKRSIGGASGSSNELLVGGKGQRHDTVARNANSSADDKKQAEIDSLYDF